MNPTYKDGGTDEQKDEVICLKLGSQWDRHDTGLKACRSLGSQHLQGLINHIHPTHEISLNISIVRQESLTLSAYCS